jgi:hypothetical protein
MAELKQTIFVVMMPWEEDGLTMKPFDSFLTRPEAENCVKNGCSEWEVVEVRVPEKRRLCGCGEPATRLNHGFPICETCYDGLRSC